MKGESGEEDEEQKEVEHQEALDTGRTREKTKQEQHESPKMMRRAIDAKLAASRPATPDVSQFKRELRNQNETPTFKLQFVFSRSRKST